MNSGMRVCLLASLFVGSMVPACASAPATNEGGPPLAPGPAPPEAEATDDHGGDIDLHNMDASLVQELAKAREQLATARRDNARLADEVSGLTEQLAARDKKIEMLQMEVDGLELNAAKLEHKLEKWQEDVLGFRAEMRDAAEAQIKVLEKVLVLLEGLKKTTPEPEPQEPKQ